MSTAPFLRKALHGGFIVSSQGEGDLFGGPFKASLDFLWRYFPSQSGGWIIVDPEPAEGLDFLKIEDGRYGVWVSDRQQATKFPSIQSAAEYLRDMVFSCRLNVERL